MSKSSEAQPFVTIRLPEKPDTIAPDGSEIRLLPHLAGGSMVVARLQPGQISAAVSHRTVEEIWYILAGTGEMWRKQNGYETIVDLQPGVSLTIPLGTHFQFRNTGQDVLDVLLVTMPPWPDDSEAYPVEGPWLSGR